MEILHIKVSSRSELSNPLATRHMRRNAVLMWQIPSFCNISKTQFFEEN
jgi:hypothetical protein